MSAENIKLKDPIETVYVIHKALGAAAWRGWDTLNQLTPILGGTLEAFELAFNSWVSALMWHVERGGESVSELLSRRQAALAGRSDTAFSARHQAVKPDRIEDRPQSLAQRAKKAVEALGDKRHKALLQRIEDVLQTLEQETSGKMAITHVQQHLYGPVLRLRRTQQHYLQEEETSVVPIIRESLDEQNQIRLVKGLLIDEGGAMPRWMLDWVTQRVAPEDRDLLSQLETLFGNGSDSHQ